MSRYSVRAFCSRQRVHHVVEQWATQHTSLSEVWEKCERGDWLIHLLRRARKLTKPLAVEISCLCAERMLPVFQELHPGDERPLMAIAAARAWIRAPSASTETGSASAAREAVLASQDAIGEAPGHSGMPQMAADEARSRAASAASAAAMAAHVAASEFMDSPFVQDVLGEHALAAATDRSAELQWQANAIRRVVGTDPFAGL